jgi:adenosylmethionine-8-amino-7-oxononanoate aminotransferase
MPLALTLATDTVYNAFLGEFRELKTFFHGHSYTGNSLACAAAIACLDLFVSEEVIKNLKGKIDILEAWLKEMLNLEHVGDARNAGMMACIELVKDKTTKGPYGWEEKMGWKVAYHARDNGVFIRPLGNVIVIMPPLSISCPDLRRLLEILKGSIMKVTEGQ